MALRCLLFTSDEATADPIRRVLIELGVEGEYCPTAVEAVEIATSQSLQIVIIDWDNQPEAEFLLKTARERKAAERPLTLAIVSSDASVPIVLQAGANSILRKPIQIGQAKDTLTTARDLLRAKMESAPMARAAAVGVAAAPSPVPPSFSDHEVAEKTLHAGEFLRGTSSPGTQFHTDSEFNKPQDLPTAGEIDQLEELEPMAAAVKQAPPALPPPAPGETRGLEWYMNARAAKMAPVAQPKPEPAQGKAELLGFDQTPSHSEVTEAEPAPIAPAGYATLKSAAQQSEQKNEAELFAYIAGDAPKENEKKKKVAKSRPWLGKLILVAVLAAVATVAYLEVPRAVWSKNLHFIASYTKQLSHNWLNPQPVTPQQAPASHENFGRAGDEYKLPVAETIPDASTDPSQIRVVPVIDPTVKPPVAAGTNPTALTGQNSVPAPGQPGDPSQATPNLVPNQTAPPDATAPATTDPAVTTPAQTPASNPAVPETRAPVAVPMQAAPQKSPEPQPAAEPPSKIPTSLKSQMASMTPDASGNKPPEAAMQSIEPVEVPEATARGLLMQQPEPVYPPTAKGQQGTVILQVMIGRDGTVQDAKFQQGSLAFARSAIDAVQQWRFKPYSMNGRPVSTKTILTLSFKPPA